MTSYTTTNFAENGAQTFNGTVTFGSGASVVSPATGIPGLVLASATTTLFGGGTGAFPEEGNIYRLVNGAGISPGATGADNVLAVFSLPANSFDGVGNRGLSVMAAGSFANNTNTKRAKIIFNPSTAVVGATVGAGGTTVVDTGSYSTTGAVGWNISGNIFKYGVANSNTQLCMPTGIIIGASHSGIGAGAAGVPAASTATENAAILIAITGNAGTTAADILLNFAEFNAMN